MANESNDLWLAAKDAQRDLPEGYDVALKIENGCMWVELETPDGIQDVMACDNLSDWVRAAVLQAIEDNKEEDE